MVDQSTGMAQRKHLENYFVGHASAEHQWPLGPAVSDLPWLRVVEFAPGPKASGWIYATIGAYEARPERPIEFLLATDRSAPRFIELLTMTAWYHFKEGLDLGHTFAIGQPWLPSSACDHMLVSLPYPFGPVLEVCPLSTGDLHYYWLLPITRSESEFKIREGQQALEERFDADGIRFWDPGRASVVPDVPMPDAETRFG